MLQRDGARSWPLRPAAEPGHGGERPWTAATALARCVEVLREEGLGALWFRSLGEICYRRLLMLERPLAEPATAISSALPIEVSVLENSAEYRELRPDTTEQDFVLRLRRGMQCFAARYEGRLVSATWARVGGGPVAYLGRELTLPEDEVYLLDTYTRPEFRGRGLAPLVASAQIELYRRSGKTRLVSLVLPENRASLRARARTGFRVCGVLGYVRFGARRRDFFRSSRRSIR